MTITFTIPYLFLRAILAEFRRQPYHVAVGQAGLHTLSTGDIEVLARSFRCVHEGAVRQSRDSAPFQYELGFVPWTFQPPEAWHAAALAATLAGDLPGTPTCAILLGSGTEAGLFTGMYAVGDQVAPVHSLRVVGAGMHRLAAVDFRAASCGTPWPGATERWSRVIGALGGQGVWQRLVSLQVCIVGMGRIGSLVATTLVQHGVRTLSVIDPDTLEAWNLDAMDAVTMRDLGRLKVEAVAANLQQRFPYTRITAVPRSIMSAEARLAVKRADILVCCVDDDAARLYTSGLANTTTHHCKEESTMERRRMLQCLALCLVLCVAGCATYTPRVVGIPETAGPGVSPRVQEHLTLSVEAYASEEKSKSVFDTDLADKGVIPLLVTVQNAGQEPYQMRSTDFVLRDGDTVMQMLSPAEASGKAKRDAVGRAVGWSLIVPIIGIPIAATSSVLHTNKVNKSIVQDFTAKAFKDGALKPHEKRLGFLFFELPKGQKALNGPRLDLTATNLATHDWVTLTTSLPAASFAAKKEVSAAPPVQ